MNGGWTVLSLPSFLIYLCVVMLAKCMCMCVCVCVRVRTCMYARVWWWANICRALLLHSAFSVLQIYHLMKMDCYPRFQKSKLVQDCVCAEMEGRPLPIEMPGHHKEPRRKVGKEECLCTPWCMCGITPTVCFAEHG